MHDHLNKLRILSKIRPGQRLNTKHELTVYEESFYNWLIRKYYHDNKDESVRFLQDLYCSIEQSTEQLISDIINSKNKNIKFKKLQVAISLSEKIICSISGIENLAKTYSAYPKTTAMLEGIVQDFAVATYTQLLNIIPKSLYSKLLRTSITYNGQVVYDANDANDANDTVCDSD